MDVKLIAMFLYHWNQNVVILIKFSNLKFYQKDNISVLVNNKDCLSRHSDSHYKALVGGGGGILIMWGWWVVSEDIDPIFQGTGKKLSILDPLFRIFKKNVNFRLLYSPRHRRHHPPPTPTFWHPYRVPGSLPTYHLHWRHKVFRKNVIYMKIFMHASQNCAFPCCRTFVHVLSNMHVRSLTLRLFQITPLVFFFFFI